MEFLLTLHGEMRWLVALVGVVALVRFGAGWAGGASYRGLDRGLMAGFTGLLDLNLVLGLLLLVGLPGLPPARLEHLVTMILAVIAAHSAAAWKRSDDDAVKFRNNLLVVLLVLALVVVGVLRLRGGWIFERVGLPGA